MTIVVAVVGILALVGMAVGVGMSMDTEAQRRAAKEVARERRFLAVERATTTAGAVRCDGCPYRAEPPVLL